MLGVLSSELHMFTLHILLLENNAMEKRETSEVAVTSSQTEGVCVCACVFVHACHGFVVDVLGTLTI